MNRLTKMVYCGTTWKIKERSPSELEKLADEPVEAFVELGNQTIYVDESLHPHRKSLAIIHEAIHIGWDHSGYLHKDEESNTRAIEHPIAELIKALPAKYRKGI